MWATQGIPNLKLASGSNFPLRANQYKEPFDNSLCFHLVQVFKMDHTMMRLNLRLGENAENWLAYILFSYLYWISKGIFLFALFQENSEEKCVSFQGFEWRKDVGADGNMSAEMDHLYRL